MARKGPYSRKPAGNGRTNSLVLIIVLLVMMIGVGILFSFTMAPQTGFQAGGLNTNSVLSTQPKSLSQKILEWLPHGSNHQSPEDSEVYPDWSQEFWSPIDVDVTNDPMITLCRLNFKEYSTAPHLFPMFRDLESMSNCRGNNKRRELLSVLMKEIKDKEGSPDGKIIKPTAFIFHESRVGSTLVANTLASNPFAMVYSESAPAANALLHCRTCTLERNVQVFRDVLTLMGRSPIHKHVFFKFQSITSTKMHIALLVSPYILFYRFVLVFLLQFYIIVLNCFFYFHFILLFHIII